jgi:hypothetical protein
VQPKPIYGDLERDFANETRRERVQAVLPFFKTNYIEHPPQTAVVEQLLTYLASMQPLLGGPIDGRRLAEHSNAGKSRMIERLVATAAARRAEAGLEPNPYQIIVFELDKTTSVAAFYRRVLFEMGDEHWDDQGPKLDELEERVLELSRRLKVEGLVGDEVQHLDRKTTNATQVTDRFKTFLNRGILPLILVGDEEAETFFKKTAKFASRLGTPLTLKPLDVRGPDGRDRKLFLDFCEALDKSMVEAGIVDVTAGLGKPGIRTQLADVSGGHVGRVCRVMCEATEHALWRGSCRVERHDLSIATRQFAMTLGWISRDPFSRPQGVPRSSAS